MARLVRAYRNILSIAIAQTQTEQANSPAITNCTTKLACQASSISETPEPIDCNGATSGIGDILSTQVSQSSGSRWLPVPQPRVKRGDKRQRESLIISHGGPVRSRGLHPLPTCQNEGYPRVVTPLTRRQSWL